MTGTTKDGRPRYIEQNKEKREEYDKHKVIPAEIIYCPEIKAWVFRHKHIHTTSATPDPGSDDQVSASALQVVRGACKIA